MAENTRGYVVQDSVHNDGQWITLWSTASGTSERSIGLWFSLGFGTRDQWTSYLNRELVRCVEVEVHDA